MKYKSKSLLFATIFLFVPIAFIGCSKDNKNETAKVQSDAAVTAQKKILINERAIELQQHHPKEFLELNPPSRKPTTITLYSDYVPHAPIMDGNSMDKAWRAAKAITTIDYVSSRPITIKSVHTKDKIFFLVQFPDVSPSTTHKSFGWDYKDGIYKQLYDREDVFVFKWSLVGNGIDLSFRNPMPYLADIWFWKAKRTDPSGYADDKIQRLHKTPNEEYKKIPIPGKTEQYLYFERKGDQGSPAYKRKLVFEYQGDIQSSYEFITPTGSRADIRAKGIWNDGVWTVEFARKLNTGHDDDIQFQRGNVYLFGVATSELAFDTVRPEFSFPLFRNGDIYDQLLLRIK